MEGSLTPSRHEKSLGLLTKKFVHLLECADDGVLDLKIVSTLHIIRIIIKIVKTLVYHFFII